MNSQALVELLAEVKAIWISGGWGMNALAVNALVMFGMGMFVLMRLVSCGVLSSPEKAFSRWRRGKQNADPLGRVVADAMKEGSQKNVELFFEAVSNSEIAPFERDLKVLSVSVSTAPLLGLLGTVTGMLTTFGALAMGGGGDQTMGMIARGISEALITTETGLVIGLTGLMFSFFLKRRHEQLIRKYVRIETLCLEATRPVGDEDEEMSGEAA